MTMAQLAELLGWKPETEGEELTEDKAKELISGMVTDNSDLTAKLETAITAAAAKDKGGGADDSAGGSQIHPELLEEVAGGKEAQVNALVEAGRITPVTAKAIKLAVIGEKGSRKELTLSITKSGGTESIAKMFLDSLELLPAKHHKSITGAQNLSLSGGGGEGENGTMNAEEKKKYHDKRVLEMNRHSGRRRTTADA